MDEFGQQQGSFNLLELTIFVEELVRRATPSSMYVFTVEANRFL
jgi:hypothetical protein